jgi:hypothetical protein
MRRLILPLLCLSLSPLLAPTVAQDSPARPAAPQAVLEGRFATSLVCARCHSHSDNAQAMRDAQGRTVAPFDLWRASMMANSARDPLWRAVVAAEAAATPSRSAEIQAECMRCHAPMAAIEAERAGEAPVDLALLKTDGARAQLALDGVSCTVCHQIPESSLTNDSGHLGIGDDRLIFGPHAEPFTGPMRRFTNYTPTHATYLRKSALCATCHTLHTETLAPDGAKTGHRLPEQTPYLEWRNSVFNDELAEPGPDAASCQACHMPTADDDGVPIETRLAHNPMGRDFPFVKPRAPYGRHVFVGGNTLVPAIFRDRAEELGTLASRTAFEATIAATRSQLTTRTARVVLDEVTREDEQVIVPVRVENLVGHKLPTGFPEVRRAWLRVRVRDAAGAIIASSGEHDASGRILGATGAPLPSELAGGPVEPHCDHVASADQVALFEAVLADAEGRPTWRLLRGASYLKDDRLLPRGWRPDHPDAAITAPVGLEGDANFTAGGDVVQFTLRAPGAAAVEVALLYQSLGARFAAELFALDAPEIARFRAMFDALPEVDRTPVVVAEARVQLP